MPHVYHWEIAGASVLTGAEIRTFRKKLSFLSDDMPGVRDLVLSQSQETDIPHRIAMDDFRRGDYKMRAYLLNIIASHQDAGLDTVEKTSVIDFGRCGCHEENVRYFQDYHAHERHRGSGHLFVGTLPTTPVCEAAISLNLHGPVYYLNAMNRFDVLWNEIEMLLECMQMQRVVVCNYTGERLVTFLAVPGEIQIADGAGMDDVLRMISE